MTREEVTTRFNTLPEEHRVTIIGGRIEQEIRWLEREKEEYKKSYQANIRRLNNRITFLERSLEKLEE